MFRFSSSFNSSDLRPDTTWHDFSILHTRLLYGMLNIILLYSMNQIGEHNRQRPLVLIQKESILE